jgi:hypothetical protein
LRCCAALHGEATWLSRRGPTSAHRGAAGAQAKYNITLLKFLTEMFAAAEESGASGIMPWMLIPWDVTFVSYDFSINDPAYAAVADMIAYQAQRVRRGRPRAQGFQPVAHRNQRIRALFHSSALRMHVWFGRC